MTDETRADPRGTTNDLARRTDLHLEAMRAALDVARAAAIRGDVPVGAAIFDAEGVVAVAGNERERHGDPTAHAEIVAMRDAASRIDGWRLDGRGLAVTLEPCTMCAGAVVLARLDLVVVGAMDPKAGATGSLYNVTEDPRLPHRAGVVTGVLAEEASDLLERFFRARRRA